MTPYRDDTHDAAADRRMKSCLADVRAALACLLTRIEVSVPDEESAPSLTRLCRQALAVALCSCLDCVAPLTSLSPSPLWIGSAATGAECNRARSPRAKEHGIGGTHPHR